MNNQNHHSPSTTYNGLNYCPTCRLNLFAIWQAMAAAGDLPSAQAMTSAQTQSHINGNGRTPTLSELVVAKRSYKKRRPRMVITDEMRETVRKLRAQNTPLTQIEKQTGMTRASIANIIYTKTKAAATAVKVPAPVSGKTSDRNLTVLNRIIEMTRNARPQKAIARELNMSPKVIRSIQREQGLSTVANRMSAPVPAT